MMQQPIRIIRHDSSSVSVEAEDWVTVDELIAFLDLEEPRLATSMRCTRDVVRTAKLRGISDQPFWQAQPGDEC